MNLAFAWFLSVVDPDDWKNDYKPIFEESREDREWRREVKEILPDAAPGEHGTFAVKRLEKQAEEPEVRSLNIR